MIKTEIITYSALVIMIIFLIIALLISDVVMSKLMASFGIIIGAFICHKFSKLNEV